MSNVITWALTRSFKIESLSVVFPVARVHTERILQVFGNIDDFFTEKEDAFHVANIDPKVKLLMALKCLAYGVLPSAFQDYFQISETSGQKCIKKMTAATANDPGLRHPYLRPLNRIDARRVVQIRCRDDRES